MQKLHKIKLLTHPWIYVETLIDLRIIENNSDANVVVDTNNEYIVIYTHRERTINKYKIIFNISWDDYKLISPFWHWGIELNFGGGITYNFIPLTNYQIINQSKTDPKTNKIDLTIFCDGYLENV